MPTDMTKYPADWPEIRNRILQRAGGREDDPRIGARCEGCGVLNYAIGYRHADGEFIQLRPASNSHKQANDLRHRELAGMGIIVVLTIAHINDPDPMNCDPDNLAALCQACHNRLDAPMRRMNRILNTGQMPLF